VSTRQNLMPTFKTKIYAAFVMFFLHFRGV